MFSLHYNILREFVLQEKENSKDLKLKMKARKSEENLTKMSKQAIVIFSPLSQSYSVAKMQLKKCLE